MIESGPGAPDPEWALGDWILPPGAWPQELRERLADIRQGYLVERPPLVYYGFDQPSLTATTLRWAEVTGRSSGSIAPRDRPPYGLIITQTCDLVEEGKPKRPWFDVAPVYVHACRPKEAERITKGDLFAYLVPITTLPVPMKGLWVADLRLVAPVEKSWLIQAAKPQPGFAGDAEQRLFWNKVGRWGRPAEPREVQARFVRPVAGLALRLRADWGDHVVAEVRYESGRDRGAPEFLRAVFLSDETMPPPVRAVVEEAWSGTYDPSLQSDGIQILSPLFETYMSVDPRAFERMTLIPLDEYSEGPTADATT